MSKASLTCGITGFLANPPAGLFTAGEHLVDKCCLVGVKCKRRAEMLAFDFSMLPLFCLQALTVSDIVKH